MNKVKIFVDSTCDLRSDLLKKYDLETIPLYVSLGDDTFKDDGSIDNTKLFDYVAKTKNLPKTAAVNIMDFEQEFMPYIDKGYDICFTGISCELSSTFQNAKLAAQQMGCEDRIHFVDSRSLSSGVALTAISMAKFRDEGLSAKEIVEKTETEIVPNVSASFFIMQLDYLYKGGRCSLLSAIFANALKICPQLVLKDGLIIPGEKYRGAFKKVCKHYIESTLSPDVDYKKDMAFVTHTVHEKREVVEDLKKQLKDEFGFKEVYECAAGVTVASHCGPDTLGVLFIKN